MNQWQRLAIASFLAGLAVHVAAGPVRPRGAPAVALVLVDDVEPFDGSDVLQAHGVQVR